MADAQGCSSRKRRRLQAEHDTPSSSVRRASATKVSEIATIEDVLGTPGLAARIFINNPPNNIMFVNKTFYKALTEIGCSARLTPGKALLADIDSVAPGIAAEQKLRMVLALARKLPARGSPDVAAAKGAAQSAPSKRTRSSTRATQWRGDPFNRSQQMKEAVLELIAGGMGGPSQAQTQQVSRWSATSVQLLLSGMRALFDLDKPYVALQLAVWALEQAVAGVDEEADVAALAPQIGPVVIFMAWAAPALAAQVRCETAGVASDRLRRLARAGALKLGSSDGRSEKEIRAVDKAVGNLVAALDGDVRRLVPVYKDASPRVDFTRAVDGVDAAITRLGLRRFVQLPMLQGAVDMAADGFPPLAGMLMGRGLLPGRDAPAFAASPTPPWPVSHKPGKLQLLYPCAIVEGVRGLLPLTGAATRIDLVRRYLDWAVRIGGPQNPAIIIAAASAVMSMLPYGRDVVQDCADDEGLEVKSVRALKTVLTSLEVGLFQDIVDHGPAMLSAYLHAVHADADNFLEDELERLLVAIVSSDSVPPVVVAVVVEQIICAGILGDGLVAAMASVASNGALGEVGACRMQQLLSFAGPGVLDRKATIELGARAAGSGSIETLNVLLVEGRCDGSDALAAAVLNHKVDCWRLLLQHSPKLVRKAPGKWLLAALTIAATELGHHEAFADLIKVPGVPELLVSKDATGMLLNAQPIYIIPLMDAGASQRSQESCQEILLAGLHRAAENTHQEQQAIVSMLADRAVAAGVTAEAFRASMPLEIPRAPAFYLEADLPDALQGWKTPQALLGILCVALANVTRCPTWRSVLDKAAELMLVSAPGVSELRAWLEAQLRLPGSITRLAPLETVIRSRFAVLLTEPLRAAMADLTRDASEWRTLIKWGARMPLESPADIRMLLLQASETVTELSSALAGSLEDAVRAAVLNAQ